MIVFDLDGVLRDLNIYLYNRLGVPYPETWYWKHDGKDIFQLIAEDNYRALTYSPATQYLNAVKPFVKEIWTCQPDKWLQRTLMWIGDHVGDVRVRNLTTEEKQKNIKEDILLVEDNPNFTNYHNILLIDTPYNRHIQGVHRIYNPEELLHICEG